MNSVRPTGSQTMEVERILELFISQHLMEEFEGHAFRGRCIKHIIKLFRYHEPFRDRNPRASFKQERKAYHWIAMAQSLCDCSACVMFQ